MDTNNPYENNADYEAANDVYNDVPIGGENAYADGSPDAEFGGSAPPKPPPPPGPKPTNLEVQAAPPPTKPGYFARLNIQITYVTVLVAIWMIAAAVLNILLSKPGLSDVIIDGYFVFFAFTFLMMMLPNTKMRGLGCLIRTRTSVEIWTRFMSTNWGRGWFYIFVSVLAFGMNSVIRIITGILLILLGILSIWCGRLAAAKYNRMREFLCGGQEGDAMFASIQAKAAKGFNVDGYLTEGGIKELIVNSGRTATTSEVHAIYAFIDRDHTGTVDIAEFAERLAENIRLKSL